MNFNNEENKDANAESSDHLKRRKIRAWCGECYQTFENGPLSKQCLDHLNKNNCNLIECRKTSNNNNNFKCVRRFKNINSENRHTYCIDMEEVNKWDINIQIQNCIKNLPKDNLNTKGEIIKSSLNKKTRDENDISRSFGYDSSIITKSNTFRSSKDKPKNSRFLYDSPQPLKTKFSKKNVFEEKLDLHKKTFLDQLNKNTRSTNKRTKQSPFISTPNKLISSPTNDFKLANNKNQPFLTEKQNPSTFPFHANSENDANNLNFGCTLSHENDNLLKSPIGLSCENKINLNFNSNKFSTSGNKIIPNKWDEMEISGKNLEKYVENKADMLTGLDECETETRKNDMESNLDFKIDNYFNNNENELNAKEENFGNKNLEISKIENNLFNKDNYFDKPNIEMDEESLVSQLDKIDFIENSNIKLLRSKNSESNTLPNYYLTPEGKIFNKINFNNNLGDYNMINNNNLNFNTSDRFNQQNINDTNNENAIIRQIFGNENLIKNDNYSSMSICPNTSIEEYNNEFSIKNETDLDLLFDMIYKSQKISLDVMFNLRNKLRIRGYNTVLSLRLKKDKDKSWSFLFEDYKDISPEMEALALVIEYYLEKKINK